MSTDCVWQHFPKITPPKNVPLWLTIKYAEGLACADGEFDGVIFGNEYNTYGQHEVVAFIVLPGPEVAP